MLSPTFSLATRFTCSINVRISTPSAVLVLAFKCTYPTLNDTLRAKTGYRFVKSGLECGSILSKYIG